MLQQIGVGLVQHRLVARGLLHRRLDVVRHHHPRRPSHVLEAANVRGAPVVDLLAQRRFGVEPPRHPHRRDEQLRPALDPVDQHRHRHAGVVDEQPLARPAVLAHRHVAPRPPLPEAAAPGDIAHPVGMGLAPFPPQQLERHAALGQVLLDLRPVHVLRQRFPRNRIERRLQRLVVEIAGLRPAQTRRREALQNQRHRAPGKPAMDRDRPRAAALVEMKRKYPLRFPHRQPSPCHRSPLGHIAEARAVGRHPESLQNPPPRGGGYFGDTGWLL